MSAPDMTTWTYTIVVLEELVAACGKTNVEHHRESEDSFETPEIAWKNAMFDKVQLEGDGFIVTDIQVYTQG